MGFDVKKFTGEGEPVPVHPLSLLVFLAVVLGSLFYGSHALYRLDVVGLLLDYDVDASLLLLATVGAAAASLLLAYGFLHCVKEYGLEGFIMAVGLFFIVIIALLATFVLALTPLSFIGMFLGVLVLVFVLSLWQGSSAARKRAERFLSMTTRIMLEEKELIIPTFLFFLISAYLLAGYWGFVTEAGLVEYVPETGGRCAGIRYSSPVPVLLSLAVFFFINQVFFFWLMGAVAGITYIWYRKEDPKLMDGINLTLHRLDKIIPFGFYAAIYHTLSMAGMVFGKTGLVLVNWVMRVLWGVLNYFTLQALVIADRKPADAIMLSAKILKNNIPDVLVKEVFVDNGLKFILQLIRIPVIILTVIIFLLTSRAEIAAVFFYTSAVVFAVILYTMNIVYRTLLFSWAIEKELKIQEHGRMPEGMQEIIDRIQHTNSEGRAPPETEEIDWSYLFQKNRRK